ncbi:MAG: hypothetical protein C7B46_16410 [Sulfobacillus benefaciens]|uniref:MotA/TolQ/ExbB proton channel domain-containing protein n=1 Tax=Sulfobacillus benefaciens TaxID=453960 RepID=A0A2T2XBR9_9FIRM|nr:MAG: hypothetical protein C7B46_16410 [Sulfobacillus benefaciens]
MDRVQNEFLAKGWPLIVENHESKMGARIFESAGSHASTTGMIGTVIGLVHALGKLTGHLGAPGRSHRDWPLSPPFME